MYIFAYDSKKSKAVSWGEGCVCVCVWVGGVVGLG